jgi:hypothetical protein
VADPNEVTTWTLLGVAGGGSILWLLRWVIRTFHVDRTANAATDAEGGIIKQLQGEIARLAEIIKKQSTRIDELEARINAYWVLEIEDAGDLAELAVLIDAHCGQCANASEAKLRMAGVVTRLRNRKVK